VIRVRAAAVNPYDWHMLRGDPRIARLLGVGLTRPKHRVAGLDAAGVVHTVGAGVTGLRPGDEVFGFFPGAFAEYARTGAELAVLRPAALTFAQAAALPIAGTTALRGVRDVARIRPGQRILVNGASGGVGSCAVQIAVALGAEVTGVCGAGNADLVRSLGAAHVTVYTEQDFTAGSVRYDAILDNVGNHPLRRLTRVLTPTGTLVLNAGGSPGALIGAVGPLARAAALDPFTRRRLRPLPTALRRTELLALADLVAEGALTPVVERGYPLADTAEALRRVEGGHTRGKVVITFP
jgi:NADPH:quinone reductase-like Zn-dependent oxidoreductase